MNTTIAVLLKKFENNSWVNAHNDSSLPTGENLNSLSLHTHEKIVSNLY